MEPPLGKEGTKDLKNGTKFKKIKLIVLFALFPSVFDLIDLIVDLKKKNQNKFCRLKMIILKIYVYFFFLFNF